MLQVLLNKSHKKIFQKPITSLIVPKNALGFFKILMAVFPLMGGLLLNIMLEKTNVWKIPHDELNRDKFKSRLVNFPGLKSSRIGRCFKDKTSK